jgi:gag-polyprotein putative aspartyl protease
MGLHRLPNGNVIYYPNDEPLKRARHVWILSALLLIIQLSAFGSIQGDRSSQLSGYKAVRVHYGSLNKMIMPVHINGQPANLLVDTGSSQVILDADSAESFGVRPSQRAQAMPRQTMQGFSYIRFTQINGQDFP